MIDIEKESTAIAAAALSSDKPTLREILASYIADLCRRVAAEALEDAAKVCDAVDDAKSYLVTTGGVPYREGGSRDARECAAAIRSRKEEEGLNG